MEKPNDSDPNHTNPMINGKPKSKLTNYVQPLNGFFSFFFFIIKWRERGEEEAVKTNKSHSTESRTIEMVVLPFR